MLPKEERESIIRLMHEQVVPAVGCTEPIAVALCVAKARELLGTMPERVKLSLSANIVKNAIESITDKGEITITTVPKTLTITDNGRGISPEVAQHIFTPFYSTKPQGQGLGLLLIRDILTKHGCTFTLLTNPDDGLTRFTIMFP